MRVPVLIAVVLASAPMLKAELLTEADREALLEKLAKIQEAADAKVDARFAMAVGAYKTALASEQGPLDLYLKCVEKVQYSDQNKKGQEFREWKRKQDDQLSSAGFQQALRHQLRWLLLTLQVASSKKPATAFGTDAMRLLDDVLADAATLGDHRNTLRQGAISSVFAQAYEIEGTKVEDWPGSPLDVNGIYERVILPPLRHADKIESLRSAWMKRIHQEALMVEKWSKDGGGVEKFQQDTFPEMAWQMELDVYRAGDQRGAALHLFQHLEKYATHPKNLDWTRQFRELLTKKDEPKPGASTSEKPAAGKP